MKQLSLMSILRSSTFVCFILFGLYQTISALRNSTSSLYGAISSQAAHEPTLNLKSVHTLIDTSGSIDTFTPKKDESTQQIIDNKVKTFQEQLIPVSSSTPLSLPPEKSELAPSDQKITSIETQPVDTKVKSASDIQKSSASTFSNEPSTNTAQKQNISPSTLFGHDTPVVAMPAHNDKDELVEFQFEGTDLENVVKQVALLYDVIFIPDDTISPLPQDSKALKGNKVSFKTHRTMTKSQAWDIFITFLHLSGFTLTPHGHPHTYRITTLKTAQHNPLPTYINVDYKDLSESDQLIRYVYFIENATTETIKGLLESFKSPNALVQILNDAKAFVITDRSYNIKVLINIIKELDKASMPQELLVLKLHQVDAQHVKDLYESLIQSQDDKGGYQRFFPPRKTPTSLYFPENVRMIAEKRTNTLIILGPKNALKVLEDFIVKHVDVDLDQPYSKITTHQLKYADAKTIENIMNNVTKLGASTDVGKVGGIRGVDKFVRLSFVAEPDTNTLLIKGDYEDYLLIKPSIEQLDKPQPQVAIEILLLAVESAKFKELGAQIRTREPALGLLGNSIKFQTQGLSPSNIVENQEGSGTSRLLGDLISLVTDRATSFGATGKTVLTLGSDKYGVWGIFRALERISDAKIISNPFITTSNKTPAKVSIGQTRRVVSSEVVVGNDSQPSYTNDEANLIVNITPQINSDGMISLQIGIEITDFTTPASETKNVTKVKRELSTNAIVANKEILALGGLIQSSSTDRSVKTPVLGDLPGIGWLFKDKEKQEGKSTLLVLISTQIINPTSHDEIEKLRKNRADDVTQALQDIDNQINAHDPIDQTFFNGRYQDPSEQFFSNYIDRKFGVKDYQELLKENKLDRKKEVDAKKKIKKDKKARSKKASQNKQKQSTQEVAA